jgi:hypothetical protein
VKKAHPKKVTRSSDDSLAPTNGHPLPPYWAMCCPNPKLVAHVEEFSLYEIPAAASASKTDHRKSQPPRSFAAQRTASRNGKKTQLLLISAPSVERALRISQFGISERGSAKARLDLALTLLDLTERAAGQFLGDSEDLLDELTGHLGGLILSAVDDAGGSEIRIRSAAARMKKVLSSVESAMRQLQRYRVKMPTPKEKTRGSWTWMLQLTAKNIFRETRQRPRQSEIWARLTDEGWVLRGHDLVESRRKKMNDAGLASLPM